MPLTQQEWREIRSISRSKLGHDDLRPGQAKALQAVLHGRDTLAIMPTGAGKSAIYQIAALMLPGPTVVVSPLIALQRDQLEAIAENGLAPAAVVNSTLSAGERARAFEQLEEDLEFILLAPEQLQNQETLERLLAARPSLFVIDEAHCISEWGHSFRPDYLRLGGVIEALDHPRILALTATATPDVRAEIATRLGMRDPVVIVTGFDRPNIWLGAQLCSDEASKRTALLARVESEAKPGIVYAATRKATEELAAALGQRGMRAAAYHAGLGKAERNDCQTAFMNDDLDVIVATTAFGMGIDKPNVRFVFHHDLSDSLDGYYQEIGRAGRDGEPARAILFYAPRDVGLRRFFASGGKVDRSAIEQVAELILEEERPVATAELRESTALSRQKITKAVTRLEEAGLVEVLPTGEVVAAAGAPAAEEAVEEAVHNEEERRQADQMRVELMRGYIELGTCRRVYLLHYFGEELAEPCMTCDVCERLRDQQQRMARDAGSQPDAAELPVLAGPEPEPYAVGARVRHTVLGLGTVSAYEGERHEKIVIDFEEAGERQLIVAHTQERGLLSLA